MIIILTLTAKNKNDPGKRHGAWFPGILSLKKCVGINFNFARFENFLYALPRGGGRRVERNRPPFPWAAPAHGIVHPPMRESAAFGRLGGHPP